MGDTRYEMRFAGSGGQGVILASVILAEAAVIAGLHAVQSQAYGPEARGGVSRAETILSRGRIWFSKVSRPDFLLALTQASLDAYSQTLAENAVVLFDDSLSMPAGLDASRAIAVPVLKCAKETVGKAFTANIVAVGAINAALRLFDDETLLEAVRRHIPAGTEEINRKALEAGAALITPEQTAAFAVQIG
ncbi:MAG: 2-oxoacid:acceptor oxidoreductase family protein [Oscillospiraceae bacterium]|nr:2-oxoacid:acceptor oxidoreductase family protein [Oscillospiraceae bacterium]